MAEYVRLRAPKEHGQTLQLPPISDGAAMLDANRRLLAGYADELKSIRDLARKEMKSLALKYSQSYFEAVLPASSDSDVIVMSGHQPTLFHPGVWYKNFVLDSIGRAVGATAINLVVDNDLGGHAAVHFPVAATPDSGKRMVDSIAIDSPAVDAPYEMRSIISRERFENVGRRLASTTFAFRSKAIIKSLWPEVVAAAEFLPGPASLAAGRHRLEQKRGLNTLELPVSVLSTSQSFARFFQFVISDAERFRLAHNEELREFRNVNRIRSRSHPVPELESDGEYVEIPFWVWTSKLPTRKRLFARTNGDSVELTDREDWSRLLSLATFVEEFQNLNRLASDTFIRPRALSTTMFSRLFASDLFIHGIGGAKYDQLGDEIVKRFFGIEPTRFMTVSATMKLPFESAGEDVESMITQLEVQLRNLRFHPESEFPNDERAVRKRELVSNRPVGSCKQWHDQIEAINRELFSELGSQRKALEDQVKELRKRLPLQRGLNSREFSFVLFPEELVEELRQLAVL